MSALYTALDKINNLQLGENMNKEYSWSNDINELIVQFYFQLTRSCDIKKLEEKYELILRKIFTNEPEIMYIKIIYKLIGYTRDIIAGKGEYNLAYMLISGLYNFSISEYCPEIHKLKIQSIATTAIESLVKTEVNEHPYGSWKDMKYFCNYHISKEDRYEYKINELNDPLFNKVVDLICGQIRCDENSPVKTLAARWIPREKSDKFGWITPILATRYYSEWYKDSQNNEQLTRAQKSGARRKCLTHFRQLVSKINKNLNTPQINQCNGTWSNINFDKDVTSITMQKQSKAFKGIDKAGKQRSKIINNEDRNICSKNYSEYLENCKSGKSNIKGKRVSIIDFVKDALSLENLYMDISETDKSEIDRINLQWKENSKQNGKLGNCIAMVDTSSSMECDDGTPMYSAIGLGIRIAEKSKVGNRILTFSATPTWVNLDSCPDFVTKVKTVRSAPWGMNTNFRAALDVILNTAINNNISPEDMKDMVLVILSDMQIDCGNSIKNTSDNKEMFQMMKEKYYYAGLKSIYNKPYELPHIVFWNLRTTDGFPSISTEENTSMMSGNNPVLLNTFCNKGIEALKELTPWNNLIDQLSNKRYNYLEKIVDNHWNFKY